MNISLTPALEKWVKDKVKAGLYTSSSEVICEALRILQQREEMRGVQRGQLKELIEVGLDDLNNGKKQEFRRDLLGSIKSKV